MKLTNNQLESIKAVIEAATSAEDNPRLTYCVKNGTALIGVLMSYWEEMITFSVDRFGGTRTI